jgi:hypothetical protein
VLRGIFGPNRDEMMEGLRKLHNVELHYLYSLPSIIGMIRSRSMRWAGHVAFLGEKRNAYRILARKLERKRPLERPRHRCENNIKMDFREMAWGSTDWNDLAWDREKWRDTVNIVMNFWVP